MTTPPRVIQATIRGVPGQWAARMIGSSWPERPWMSIWRVDDMLYHADTDLTDIVEHTLIPGTLPEVVRLARTLGAGTLRVDDNLGDEGLEHSVEYHARRFREYTAVLAHRRAEQAKKAPTLAEDVATLLAAIKGRPVDDFFHGVYEADLRLRAALDRGDLDGIEAK